jgi:NAD(P)-dependent dehydrogenase (short-subunit alcohol dehydrogenase family)
MRLTIPGEEGNVGLMGLEDRVCVVTGGASGIGRATVDRLVSEGARVAIVDVDATGMERAARDLGVERVLALTADVSSEDDVAGAFAAARERFGRVDAVHNNAGIEAAVAPLADVDMAEFDRVVRVNLRGSFLVLREMLRTALDQGSPATVVNTASGAGVHAVPRFAAYSATKAGVIQLTRSAAREYAAAGVRVNAVVPGPIETPLFAALPDEFREGAMAGIPLGRLGRVEEVAALTAWLLSDECPFATGGIYSVDGGETA